MGYVFDSTCIVWQENECGERGSCWVYDNALLSTRLMTMTIVIKVMSSVFFFIAYMIYKAPTPSDNTISTFDSIKPNGLPSVADNLPDDLPPGYVPYVRENATDNDTTAL